LCGMLVRISFIASLHTLVEHWMSRYVPGHDTYKGLAEEKLHSKLPVLPYGAALIRHGEFWFPSYVIENDSSGNYVLFLPNIQEPTRGMYSWPQRAT
jgi:hypothetical protein